MQTGDGRRDYTIRAKACSSIKSDLFQPSLIEGDFLRGIRVGSISEILVSTIEVRAILWIEWLAYNVCEMWANASRFDVSANQFMRSSISLHSRDHAYLVGVFGQISLPVPGGLV